MENEPNDKDFEFLLPYESALAREVYAHFGLASFFAQCFEKGLFNLIGCLVFEEKSGEWSKKDFENELDKLEQKTIAPLLKKIKQRVEFTEDDRKLFVGKRR